MKKELRLELARDDLTVLEKMYEETPSKELKEDIKSTKKEIKKLEKD